MPSQDTFLRMLAMVDPSKFHWVFHQWVREVFPGALVANEISMDGKTARCSGDKKAESKALHLVSALACDAKVVLAQVPTSEESRELNAIREPPGVLEVLGSLVRIDAMECQTNAAKRILEIPWISRRLKGGMNAVPLRGLGKGSRPTNPLTEQHCL